MDLATDTMNHTQDIHMGICSFMCDQYLSVASVSRAWLRAYNIQRLPKTSRGVCRDSTVSQFVTHLVAGFSAPCGERACALAASYGRTDLIRAAYDSRLALKLPSACVAAAKHGQLQTLVYLGLVARCPWDSRTVFAAVAQRNMVMVKWLVRMGCPSNNGALLCASGLLDVRMVKFLVENGHPMSSSVLTSAVWAGPGAIKIIQLARELGYEHPKAFSDAIDAGHLSLLKALENIGYPWESSRIIKSVGREGVKQEIVDWLILRGYI